MEKITKKAKDLWGDSSEGFNRCIEIFAEEIDSEFEVLRQEIRDLKSKKSIPKPHRLQCGDFVSYMDRGKKVWGIVHNQSYYQVWAYWQKPDGNFCNDLTFMVRDRVAFEFRPDK